MINITKWEPKGEEGLLIEKINKATKHLNFHKISAKLVSRTLNRVRCVFSWQDSVKSVRSMMNPFIRIGSLLIGGTTKELVLGILACAQSVYRLRQAQGDKGCALYLKASSIYLMKNWSGNKLLDQSCFGPIVGLNRQGIPLWIPRPWRSEISKRNLPIFRIVMTICNLYRVLDFSGTLKLSTITNPWSGRVPEGMSKFTHSIFRSCVQNIKPFPRHFYWDPKFLVTRGPGAGSGMNTMSGFGYSLRMIFNTPMKDHIEQYCSIMKLDSEWKSLKIVFAGASYATKKLGPIGKLAFKQEPGKVRVFAMVDCITQWLLSPLHEYLFSVLKGIEQDATFNQEAGIERVRQALLQKTDKSIYSFDLSAATDRLPISIQIDILNALREGLGTVWGKILVDRDYRLPNDNEYVPRFYPKDHSLRYAVGQPMGALSSWAMLALTHHMIVQFAARRENLVGWFSEYMILGDDIVIYNSQVAKAYLDIMTELGVEISATKTLTSRIGVFEFAKRLVGPEGYAQGLPLAEFAAARFNLNILWQAFRGRDMVPSMSLFLRFLGFGYKVLGSLNQRIGNLHWRSGLMETVGLLPGLTKSSLSSLGEWMNRSTSKDLSAVIDALVTKCYLAVPPITEVTRWNIWKTMFKDQDPEPDLSKERELAIRHLELLFGKMFQKRLIRHKQQHMAYTKLLETTAVSMTDWKSVDTLISIIRKAPLPLLLSGDEDQVGLDLREYSANLEGEDTVLSLSMPVTCLTKLDAWERLANQWEPPVTWQQPYDPYFDSPFVTKMRSQWSKILSLPFKPVKKS